MRTICRMVIGFRPKIQSFSPIISQLEIQIEVHTLLTTQMGQMFVLITKFGTSKNNAEEKIGHISN